MRILLIALLAVAAFPAAADAATVSRTGGTLRYEAGKGERISGSLSETSSGAFLARSDKSARQRLTPGPGCKRSRPREIRCAGQGVARVQISLERARTTSFFTLQDVAVPVAGVGSAGTNTMLFSRTPDFTYDGGPKRDAVDVRDSPGGHSTIRLGAGADFFDGQPPAIGTPDSTATFTVDGGAGRDYLMGCGAGADIVFTNAAAPADCERVNVGMHVLGAGSIGRNGVVRARIDCTDQRGCVLRGLVLTRRGHEASIESGPGDQDPVR